MLPMALQGCPVPRRWPGGRCAVGRGQPGLARVPLPSDLQAGGPRAYVWRKLKQLGAVWLQQAVAVFPERADLRAALTALSRRIEGWGGEATLLTTRSSTPVWESRLIARFTAARTAEYSELGATIARLEDGISQLGQGPKTAAQLPALEARLRR
jgi:hypothetical protein